MPTKKYNQGEWSLMSQRQRMSPFPNYMSMESVCKEMKKFVGIALKEMILFFQGNIMFAFQHTDWYRKAGRFVANQVHNNPRLYAQLVSKQQGYGKELVDFCKRAAHKVLKSKVTNTQLYDFFAGYENRYKMVYASYGSVWTMEDELNADLYAIIEKRIKDPVEASNILNTLTKQPLAMVATLERQALLKLAVAIHKKLIWKEFIMQGAVDDIKKQTALHKRIAIHKRDFYWITRDYEDPILTYEKIVERLKEFVSTNPAGAESTLMSDLKNSLLQRKEYEKRLKLSKRELALFAAMRDAAHLKELRKKFVSQSLYHFDPVLMEIGKLLYLSIKQVRFMRTIDVEKSLLQGEDLTNELNSRMKLSTWHVVSGRETAVTTGASAEEVFNAFCTVDKNIREFTGMPVSPGVARGPAKLVMNPNECDKVGKGDIIVSIQVVPSFSTAIIKSAGIVCDGGHGITSHPATLAREANIPCVIQTRFAREVVKDGDILEVDGYKGTVKIIEKKS